MRTEYKIFGGVALFIYASAAFYAWYSEYYMSTAPGVAKEQGHMDWIGVVALILSGTLCLMCAGYFWFVARRIDLRPEDDPDGEIHEGAGEIGFFSPGSYWPFGLALAASVAGMGVVFWMPWLIALGALAILGATGGLLFEYYTGTRKALGEH
ncbi:cytochrome c oxidase subunit 4 [Longispora albida]|uniref:cytochrome c oxidase subunit 4 n=1 Tax=Longispora albida TaxID=203523 RepID=UPI0003674E34|nr:cytochrome c oxidase subunit 4 [Longispora albida]